MLVLHGLVGVLGGRLNGGWITFFFKEEFTCLGTLVIKLMWWHSYLGPPGGGMGERERESACNILLGLISKLKFQLENNAFW